MRETEVKLRIAHSEFLAALERAGLTFREEGGWEEQEDIYLDTKDGDLRRRGLALRIRVVGSEILVTLKGGASFGPSGEKVREELELPLTDPGVAEILAAAGLRIASPPSSLEELFSALGRGGLIPRVTVRKRRKKISVPGWNSLVFLDLVDGLGEFVEVEGEDSPRLVAKLGLGDRAVRLTYADLVEALSRV